MAIFSGSVGALIKLRCPKCEEDQARARGPRGTVYACRKCRHRFTREQGTKSNDKAPPPPPKKKKAAAPAEPRDPQAAQEKPRSGIKGAIASAIGVFRKFG